MALTILFLSKEKTEEPNPGIFGFESFRYGLWGSNIMVDIGCEIIPSLKETDIYARGMELIQLKSELLLIENNVDRIEQETKIDRASILIRVKNLMEFVDVAIDKNIGIFIG